MFTMVVAHENCAAIFCLMLGFFRICLRLAIAIKDYYVKVYFQLERR